MQYSARDVEHIELCHRAATRDLTQIGAELYTRQEDALDAILARWEKTHEAPRLIAFGYWASHPAEDDAAPDLPAAAD